MKDYIIYKQTCISRELLSLSSTAGHFPPSSNVTGVRCSAAAIITALPTFALPT